MSAAEIDIITLDEDAYTVEGSGDAAEVGEQPEEVHAVPTYSTTFTDFLTVPEYNMETGALTVSAPRRAMSCFNCLGDHTMYDCPEPRNMANIAKNRRAHNSNRPASAVRYHELFSSKYGHFSAGRMSAELRHALGLRSHQISETVYRMRLLGYPPGWLMEAREQMGQVMLIGADGRAVCQPGGEDGEVSGGAKYKPEKLIEYPGFNVPMAAGLKEESNYYNLPVIQEQHSLQHWRSIMNRNRVTPYRKRKMRPANTGHIDTHKLKLNLDDSQDSQDSVRTEDSTGSLECRKSKRPRVNQSLEDGEVESDKSATSESSKKKKKKIFYSLEDGEVESDQSTETSDKLENKKLEAAVSENTTITLDSTADDSSIFLDTEPSAASPTEDNKSEVSIQSQGMNKDMASRLTLPKDPNDDSNSNSSSSDHSMKEGKKTLRRSGSTGFVFGAFIPESITEYKELPDFDKWTVDVTDHILFENLPDAIGTWDTMRGIMKKVRRKITELHDDD